LDSNIDELLVADICKKYNIKFIGASYFWGFVWKKASEQELRSCRISFFESHISCIKSLWMSSALLLWHHLDDRIETTILNLIRGCWLKWFYNMSFSRNWLKRSVFWFNLQYVVFRPLIDFDKHFIKNYCDLNKILYHVDDTNADITLSQRNKIRSYIWNLWVDKTFFADVFFQTSDVWSNICIVPLRVFSKQVTEYYKVFWVHTIADIQHILGFIGAYKNIYTTTLVELLSFCTDWVWIKTVWKRKLIKSHWVLYLLLASDFFRKKESVFINTPKKISWKKPSKRFINQKIPFFLRNFVYTLPRPIQNKPPSRDVLEDQWFL